MRGVLRHTWMLAFLALGCKSSEKKTVDAMGADAPQLRAIHELTFLAPFGCGSNTNATSGLFLSEDSKANNRPHMILMGECTVKPIFKTAVNNTNIGLIADLGNVPMEEVTGPKAFNFPLQAGKDSVFKTEAPMEKNKTYVALFTEPTMRALLVFRVIETGGNDKAYKDIKIRYMFLDFLSQKTLNSANDPNWKPR